MRLELMRMVSGRLALPERLAETLLAAGGARAGAPGPRPANGSRAPGAGGSGREETERAFLALCISSPQEGRQALESLDVEEHFASELLRRAARRLREGSLHEPMAGDAERLGDLDADPELKALLAELVVEAGRERAHPAMLEVQRLQLELARMDREIQRARGSGAGDTSGLAQQRAEVKREFDRAYAQVLEDTGARES
jgi:hypothetical protein